MAALLLFFLSFCAATNDDPEQLLGCTAIVTGPSATKDGSVINAYTADTRIIDFRISKVPASTWEDGAERGIASERATYPRYIGYQRGETYLPQNVEKGFYDWKISEHIAKIPQVKKTYGYLEGSYGMQNEYQLTIGESTCGAIFSAKPVHGNGSAMWCVNELSRIALERTKTARDAIMLMGELAEKHGYYGAEWEDEHAETTAGETLTVSDTREGWVFNILPDDTGKSAIWAAQRVKDDHVAVVGNEFIIRNIDLKDPDYFMASKNVYEVARRQGLWNGTVEDFDFSRCYARFPVPSVEQTLPRLQWIARRPWRLLSLLAPSLNLKPDLTIWDYPFSVKPDVPVDVPEMIKLLRDHYEGTPWDLTKGFGAGPFGDPNRFGGAPEGVPSSLTRRGTFERPTSVTSVAYHYVAESRPWLPDSIGGRLWFGPHSPHSGVFSPIYSASATVPKGLRTGSLYKFSFDSTWWVFCLVTNYAQRAWRVLDAEVEAKRKEIESRFFDEIREIEKEALKVYLHEGDGGARLLLGRWADEVHAQMLGNWTELFFTLVTKFHDGGLVNSLTSKDISYTPIAWPLWWLEQAGYFKVASKDAQSLDLPKAFDNPPDGLVKTYPRPMSTMTEGWSTESAATESTSTESTSTESTSTESGRAAAAAAALLTESTRVETDVAANPTTVNAASIKVENMGNMQWNFTIFVIVVAIYAFGVMMGMKYQKKSEKKDYEEML